MKKIKYGVYGGKTFGGTAPTINKYFVKKASATKFVRTYKMKFPQRKLTLIKI